MDYLAVYPDGTGTAFLGGTRTDIHADTPEAAREQLRQLVAHHAADRGEAMHVTVQEGSTTWAIVIDAEGHVASAGDVAPTPDAPPRRRLVPVPVPAAPSPDQPPWPDDPRGPSYQPMPMPMLEEVLEQPVSYPPRRSFLADTARVQPATQGWRGALNATRLTRLAPGPVEEGRRRSIDAVSQHWPGPRTVAIVNGKGGAGKTPTTILLSAVFARYGGAGVLAWDNNQFRGTLGWRTEQGPHQGTLLELLPQVPRLLGTGAQSADLARFVHHQTQDRYDVLRSKPMALADEQRISPADVTAIHDVATKYYRLVFMDSGNDESDPAWRAMIDHTDQLVVATTTRDDHAEAGALLLEALADRDERSAHLSRQAVTIVTQADSKARPGDVAAIANGYKPLARAAVTIPYDPAMVDGLLRYAALSPATQDAWLSAAAAVAQGL
ncbi:MinD/ParA family ATP-binding protein [Propionicicella superfundia]|uniref:MinD/ParA family ATP-binding protein n=1 Tax=Propionicicella superfundia TaxID=348582 RepID=UPI000400CE6D|nr:ATPase [Propionicicella superfundia]